VNGGGPQGANIENAKSKKVTVEITKCTDQDLFKAMSNFKTKLAHKVVKNSDENCLPIPVMQLYQPEVN
jgi:hypothetical protein